MIDVGIIGCGYWGSRHVRCFAETRSCRVRMVADLDPERLSHVTNTYGIERSTQNYTELLESDVEAVVIATPVSTHYEVALAALRHGKHVLVEKPITTDVARAAELIETARRFDRVLMVGHTFLYHPAVVMVRDLIAAGEIGRVHYADSVRVNLGILRRDVNVMWDLAAHDLSILLFVLGSKPFEVSATGSSHVVDQLVDVAYMNLRFPEQVTAHVRVSWLDPCKVRRTTIIGDQKMLVFDDGDTAEKVKVYDKAVEVTRDLPETFGEFQLAYRQGSIVAPFVPIAEPLKVQCDDFLRCVRDGSPPLSDGRLGLEVVRILEAAQRSLDARGAPETIESGPEAPVWQAGNTVPAS